MGRRKRSEAELALDGLRHLETLVILWERSLDAGTLVTHPPTYDVCVATRRELGRILASVEERVPARPRRQRSLKPFAANNTGDKIPTGNTVP